MTILVTGATGNIGAEVVRVLTEKGEQARPLVRGPDGPDLNEPPTLRPALQGVRGLFLLPGYADMAGVMDEAAKAGVDHVVLLSGSSADAGDLDNAISRYMVRSEEAVRASGLAWTILRPNAFMSNALRWLPQLRAGDTVRAEFPHAVATVIDPYDIASVAAIALTSAGHDRAIYRLTGPAPLLAEERVRILGAVLGRDLKFVGLGDEETRAEMSKTMPPEYVEAFWSFYVDGTLDESMVTPTVAEVTGRAPHTFEQWAMAHRDAFTA
jgi:uncharacterized protein YbjT (DUF2867 family)